MIISHRHRFVLFHNPKTAGMSLRAILGPYHDDPTPLHGTFLHPSIDYPLDLAHLRLWEIGALFPRLLRTVQSYRSVVFVRNPYTRFVSGLDQYFKSNCPDLPLAGMRPTLQTRIIETFVETTLRLEMVRANHRFVHLSPQSWYLRSHEVDFPGDIIPMDGHGTFLARGFKSLGLTPRAVPHENRSRLDLTHVLTSPKIRAFVRNFYAEDFAFFAADPALAHLTEEAGHGPSSPGTGAIAARALDEAVTQSDLLAACQVSSTPVGAPFQPIDAAEAVAVAAEINRAAIALAEDRAREAFARVRTLLAKHPDHPRALAVLGQIAVFAGHPAAGLAPLQRAVALDPRLEHRVWLALCLAKLDCIDDAVRLIAAGIETIPPTANAHFTVGLVFYALGRHAEAARFYGNCIALDATRAEARHRYARALQAAGNTESAVDAYREAIRTCGTDADYYTDFSSALSMNGYFEEAHAAAKTGVALKPQCVVALNNLGHALQSLNRSAEAALAYERAIALCGTYAKAQLGLALALLKCGDFARGWRQYEWRWQNDQRMRADLDAPVWRGEDVSGRTILLHAEQGLGDTLQFVRFAPLVAALGARVVLEVPAPLVRLLRGVDGVAQVIAAGDPVPRVDLHCPMASLPLAFDLRPETLPVSPYLPTRPPERHGPGLIVGLVWAGDPRPSQPGRASIDQRRSMRLDVLAPLFDVDGVRFVSFQFGPGREQLAAARWPVIDAMEGVADFTDTTDRLRGIDLLISVDTSMVHLAGGIGLPVWMLSRFDGCWRWLEDRSDSPWYPTMHIFRQRAAGDWSGVVADVAAALRIVVRDGGLFAPVRSQRAPYPTGSSTTTGISRPAALTL